MKVILVLSLWLLAFAAATDVTCPEEDGAHISNPADCSTFFVCENGVPILMHCMEGTWFNPAVEVCDWPENVEPGICIPPPDIETTTYGGSGDDYYYF